MTSLRVKLSSGETLDPAANGEQCVLGRGRPACWGDDPQISRVHVLLSAVEGCPDILLLDNQGLNPVLVETRQNGAAEGWELKEFLDQGMSALVTAGTRFYILSNQASTLTIVEDSAGAQQTAITHDAQLAPGKAAAAMETSLGDALAAAAEQDADNEPAAKRQRTGEPSGTSGGNAAPLESPFSLTWVRGLSPTYNTGCFGARLRHIVQGPIQFALVENYMIDLCWLLTSCPDLAAAGKVVVVHGEHGDRAQAITETIQQRGLSHFSSHRPPLPISYGTHHSKAFLLHFATGLRLVVHTANLIYSDCNNKTQGLWCQDFPPKGRQGAQQQGAQPSGFEQDLLDYFSSLRLPSTTATQVAGLIQAHDFSWARGRLVASVPGYHTGAKLRCYGHMRVRALLSQVQLPACFDSPQLLCQCSSLGSLDEKWLLQEFGTSLAAAAPHAAAAAAAGHTAPPAAAVARRPAAAAPAPTPTPRSPRGPGQLCLVWPSVGEVRDSLEGWVAGYSIPGPHKNVSRPFLQPYLRRFGGTPAGRQRAMPHIKTYCRYAGSRLAWFLLGSHNLSKAAWGSLQKNGQQIMVRSYELGVLLLPELEAAYRNSSQFGFNCTGSTPAASAPDLPTPPPGAPSSPAAPSTAAPGPALQPTAEPSTSLLSPRQPHSARVQAVEFWAWSQESAHPQHSTSTAAPPAERGVTAGSAGTSSSGALTTAAASAGGPALALVAVEGGSAAPGHVGQAAPGHVGQEAGGVCVCPLPLPYPLPPVAYGSGDQPWMCDVEYPGMDALGNTIGVPARFYGRVEPPDSV